MVFAKRFLIGRPSALFYDSFTDTNGVLLTNHAPDTDISGSGWAAVTGDFTIQGNRAVTQIVNRSIRANATRADRTITARIYSMTAINALGQAVIFTKIQDSVNWVRVQITGAISNSTIEIRENVAGAVTVRASTTIANTTPAYFDFTIVTNGSSTSVDVESAEGQPASMSYGSTILTSNTYIGMQSSTTNAEFDDMRVTV